MLCVLCVFFVFFKQKTAYEMRISDWSSDVCSSDLRDEPHPTHSHTAQAFEWIARVKPRRAILTHMNEKLDYDDLLARCPPGVEPGYDGLEIGRASGRERVCQYV